MSPASGDPPAARREHRPCVVPWGVRGSIPSPGPGTAGVGGNTSCVEIGLSAGRRLVFDAGTGIRALGKAMVAEGRSSRIDLFLTHFHKDHIQGLPFFAPLYDAGTRIQLHGLPQAGRGIESLVREQMSPIYFPIPFSMVAAELGFRHVDSGPWDEAGLEVAAFPARHPASTCGYRVRTDDLTVVYMPDNELIGGAYPVDGTDWYDRLIEFIGDADLLLHDAMFTDAEYPARTGWGHSTWNQAVRLATDAGVARLVLFHHAPDRTDSEIEELMVELRPRLDREGSPPRVEIAREGQAIELEAGRESMCPPEADASAPDAP